MIKFSYRRNYIFSWKSVEKIIKDYFKIDILLQNPQIKQYFKVNVSWTGKNTNKIWRYSWTGI